MAIGYACLVVGVEGTELRRCILKNASEDNLRKIILNNLSALNHMIDYNVKNHIKLFRISSDIIPFGSHPVNQILWWEDYQEKLSGLGQKIEKAGIRVSMHPGQYTVLNSPNASVVANAIKELEYHERFLSSLGMSEDSKLILHIWGVYGDKKKAMDLFIENYCILTDPIKKRLVIENDDRNYNIEETLSISKEIGIPVVFDNLHHKLNPPSQKLSDREWIDSCSQTWSKHDGIQKIHYSQQKEGAKPGNHSDTIDTVEFLRYYMDIIALICSSVGGFNGRGKTVQAQAAVAAAKCTISSSLIFCNTP